MQFIFLIHGLQVGVGQLSLPRELAEKGGTDSWLALFIGYAISTAASLAIIQVMRRKPDGSLIDLLEHYFGKWAGIAGALAGAAVFTIFTMEIVFSAGQMVKSWVLQKTPLYMLIILFSIPTFAIIGQGIRAISRYAEFVFYMFIPMAVFLFMPLQDSYFIHLLPFLKEGWGPVIKSVKSTVLSFSGFEFAFFAYPFLKRKELASVGIVIANTLSLCVYLIITLACFLYFSPDEITVYNQPALNLLKVIELRFVERIEIIFLSFYLFMVSTSWIPYMYGYSYCLNRIMPRLGKKAHLAVMMIGLITIAVAVNPSFMLVEKWMRAAGMSSLVASYALPFCLLAYILANERIKGRKSG